MYIFPGYVTCHEENAILYVYSKLRQNKIKISDKKLIQEFYKLKNNNGCQSLSTPLTKFLHEQELLQDSFEIENAVNEAKKLLTYDLFLTIMPTEGCNFRCPYCYETHDIIIMSSSIIRQIEKYISEQVPSSKNVYISWFGGEPTLCKNVILEFSSFLQSLQTQFKFKYDANMTTNGFLMDRDSFLSYYKAGITSYQITLDGWNHDKTRPHKSGEGTLNIILKNLLTISSLPKEEYQFRIIIRHNILAGDKDFSWYDFLYKLFGTDKRFSLAVVPVKDWGGETVKSLDLPEKNSKNKLQLLHEEYLDKIGMQREGTKKVPFSDICYSSCPHGFIFRADGRIEKCSIVPNNPKNLVGYVDSERGVILDQVANQLWCTSDLKPKCLTCSDVLSCLNICCRKTIIVDGHSEGACLCAETNGSNVL